MGTQYNVAGHLPKESNGIAVQCLGVDHSDINSLAFTGSAQNLSIPTGAEIVELAASEDCFINWNATAASTTAQFFPKGSVVYKLLVGQTTLSVISNGTNGTITMVAMK